MLNSLGLSYMWTDHRCQKADLLKVKLRMRDQYQQEWLQEITDSSKLLLYKSIKYEHNLILR